MESNKKLRRSENRDKRERFSIRKFNVVVAAFWMVGGSQIAAADTVDAVTPETTVEVVEAPAEEEAPVADEEPAAELVVETVAEEAPVTPETSYVDEEGTPLAPTEECTLEPKDFEGYELVDTKVDEKGHTTHVYRKVATSIATPAQPVAPATKAKVAKAEKPVYVTEETKSLPNTGEESNAVAVTGLGMLLSVLGLTGLRRRKED